MTNYRDIALELVENGMVSAEDMLVMALKYMSNDDVEDMLDTNELSERFFEDDEPDVDYLTELYDAFGEDC
jgi:hypothetical protein